MKNLLVRRILSLLAVFALALTGQAQVVQFRATINAAQEAPTASTSAATGSAIMIYDVAANTFDLVVTINNLANTATASHLHEAAAGVSGSVVTSLGAEAVYVRTGNTLSATFRGVTFGGDKLKLLQNGAYFNLHSAAFPSGEVRGQLIAQPKRLYANIDVAQERVVFPANAGLANLTNAGAAVMTYDPGTNRLNVRISIHVFTNTLTAPHFHEAAAGVSGPVSQNLGAGTVANYVIGNGTVTGTFLNLPYGGDPIKLLTGGAYLNFHSNINGSGECRGQVLPSEEVLTSRMSNLSARGFVGAGDQALIAGLSVTGPEPVRVLVTAKGPSLSAFNVSGVLANPSLALYDSAGNRVALNDDIGAITAGSELSTLYGIPTNAVESAVVVVLRPGNYSAVVTGGSGTGIALVEAYDLRNAANVAAGVSATVAEFNADLRAAAADSRLAARLPTKAEIELCGLPTAPALAVLTAAR